MVRIFIRNGACGVEEFFKLVSSENKVAVLLTCYEKEAATFQELGEALRESMDSSALAKRLSEFVAAGLLEKLVYSSSCTVYRITQKGVDMFPCLEMMHTFCREWLHVESERSFDWISCTKRLLGSRWNSRIIWLLFALRSVRFNELKNSIDGISFKMLTQQLRSLAEESIVIRTDFETNPPHTEYSLTREGEALYQILIAVSSWDALYNRERVDKVDTVLGGMRLPI